MQTNNQSTDLGYVRLAVQMLQDPRFNTDTVVVYSFMLNRYRYFMELCKTRATTPEYYESMSGIAEGVGVSLSTVKRAVKRLKEHGYLESKLVRKANSFNNSYVVYDKHNIYADKADKPKPSKQNITTDDRPAWMQEPEENLPF